ncbi:MAG: adenylate cyclase [Chromatiales bacterium 21-64-14]|nr:MAG: adenylate cyclase [Chromatiales bacterium 21-64-14]HQU16686.1 CYTH domain-containing protein [Gammaproteobacteria bacterium]
MATEIERKFLVRSDAWRTQVRDSTEYRQGYFAGMERCSVRVRVGPQGAFLNIKGATLGVERHEYEYPIPKTDAEELLAQFCVRPMISKVRHRVPYAGHLWEIDVFQGDNAGLVVAEIELGAADEAFERPEWLGEEVSNDPRYYNVCLVSHPYKDWS